MIAPLTTIMDWYQRLPKRARESLSLANLHDLAKHITAAAEGFPCTDCGGTGISHQTERVCTCQVQT